MDADELASAETHVQGLIARNAVSGAFPCHNLMHASCHFKECMSSHFPQAQKMRVCCGSRAAPTATWQSIEEALAVEPEAAVAAGAESPLTYISPAAECFVGGYPLRQAFIDHVMRSSSARKVRASIVHSMGSCGGRKNMRMEVVSTRGVLQCRRRGSSS